MKIKTLSAILIASTLVSATSKAAVVTNLNNNRNQASKKNYIIGNQINLKELSNIKQKLNKAGIYIVNGKNCIETILPDNNKPDTEKPNQPDNNQPDIEKPDNSTQVSYIEQVVSLVNKEREKVGLTPLSMEKNITTAAQVRAKEIQTSFSHTRPDGKKFSTVLSENGVSFKGAGENIAWGQKTPEEVMKGWMNSPGHRANILNKNFRSIGVGYYQNASGKSYWTQLFRY